MRGVQRRNMHQKQGSLFPKNPAWFGYFGSRRMLSTVSIRALSKASCKRLCAKACVRRRASPSWVHAPLTGGEFTFCCLFVCACLGGGGWGWGWGLCSNSRAPDPQPQPPTQTPNPKPQTLNPKLKRALPLPLSWVSLWGSP